MKPNSKIPLTLTLLSLLVFSGRAQALPQEACTFSALLKKAYIHERLTWESLDEERRRMAKAPWLPSLSVGYDRVIKETNSIDVNDNISVSSGGVFVGPDDNNLTQSINAGDQLRFRALWRLDQLLYPDARLNTLQLERHLFKDRQSLSEDLFKAYLEREKVLAQIKAKAGAFGQKEIVPLQRKLKALNDRLNAQSDDYLNQCKE